MVEQRCGQLRHGLVPGAVELAEQAEGTLDVDVPAAEAVGEPFLDWSQRLEFVIAHLEGGRGASARAQRELVSP